MKIILSGILLYLSAFVLFSQKDSSITLIEYTPEFRFNEGIFLNFDQVKQNSPLPKTHIITTIDYNTLDFFDQLVENKTISIIDQYGMQQNMKIGSIWGYSKRGILYINHNNEFNRIPVLGNISHFVANKTYVDSRNYNDPYYYNPYNYNMRNTQPTTTTTELRQYILDFETGKVMDYSTDVVEVILMRDTELYDEFNALKKREKKKMIFLYLRKYNNRNPIYFPKLSGE